LHPANVEGLIGVMNDLVADGNSVILVDHDTQVLAHADHIVELGPKAGANGGRILAEGTPDQLKKDPSSMIGRYIDPACRVRLRQRVPAERLFDEGAVEMDTLPIHTVKPLHVRIPKGRLTVVTGVSGSGKTTMVLESLVPALQNSIAAKPLPSHVRALVSGGITAVKLIDATPIGINVRSTVATYADIHDELRKVYAKLPAAKEGGITAGDFSYNTGSLRCPTCDGTGSISLDVQFLPDVDVPCPDCRGSRYAKAAASVKRKCKNSEMISLPELMSKSVDEAIEYVADLPLIKSRLETLQNVGLGYLTLGEATPGLSGGEAQRLKLASEIGRGQAGALFVFDEPTIGLHPLDVATLVAVFDSLIAQGATVVIIEHDLDVIRNADYILDMGPLGGEMGGEIVAMGTPEDIAACSVGLTGKYLA
jgi:excinuclease ABC subunit A